MKLQREPIEIDLYVVNKTLSEAEKNEMSEFIRNDKKKHKKSKGHTPKKNSSILAEPVTEYKKGKTSH